MNHSLVDKLASIPSTYQETDLRHYNNYDEAYHYMMWDIVLRQKKSTELVMKGTEARRIFVDGGFSKNNIFMTLLAASMPGVEVYAAAMAQASALGAALAIHDAWNTLPLRKDIISLKHFSGRKETVNV